VAELLAVARLILTGVLSGQAELLDDLRASASLSGHVGLDPLRQRVAEGQVVGRREHMRGAPGTRHDRCGGNDGGHDAEAAYGQTSRSVVMV
jgi:hypothetical protein